MNNRPLGIGDFLIELKEATFKGDVPGHEFHGNQYSDGGGSSGGDNQSSSTGSSTDMDKVLAGSKPTGAQTLAHRTAAAENSFVKSVMDQFGKTEEEAKKILEVFKKEKIFKHDKATVNFTLSHGAFWDKQVMDNALRAYGKK